MHEIRMRFQAKNALSTPLLEWLRDELRGARGRPLLVTGDGDAFSAGLDLREIAGLDRAGVERFLRLMDEVVRMLFDHDAPTVAYVNGHVIAGGCILAQCCDVRVGTDNAKAKIGINELALGACIPPIALRVLAYRSSRRELERAVFGAKLVDPATAVQLGWLDVIGADAESIARTKLAELAAIPAATFAVTKAALHAGVTSIGNEEERRFAHVEVPIWAGDEMKQRLATFLGKR